MYWFNFLWISWAFIHKNTDFSYIILKLLDYIIGFLNHENLTSQLQYTLI